MTSRKLPDPADDGPVYTLRPRVPPIGPSTQSHLCRILLTASEFSGRCTARLPVWFSQGTDEERQTLNQALFDSLLVDVDEQGEYSVAEVGPKPELGTVVNLAKDVVTSSGQEELVKQPAQGHNDHVFFRLPPIYERREKVSSTRPSAWWDGRRTSALVPMGRQNPGRWTDQGSNWLFGSWRGPARHRTTIEPRTLQFGLPA